MAHLSLSLFGTFRAALEGEPDPSFETVRTRALLAYLADEPGKPHPRVMLGDLLWPERPQGVLLNNLRNVLAGLRRSIRDAGASPPFLMADHETIALNPHSSLTIDVVEFTRLINEAMSKHLADPARIACLEQAAALYQGDFLENFPVIDSADFEDWILARRENYRSRALDALFDLTEAALACAAYSGAKGYARRQIEIETWREEAYQQLMVALAAEGHRGEALAVFAACREILDRELGVQPCLATTRLFERIRDGDLPGVREQVQLAGRPSGYPGASASRPAPGDNLPHPLTSFIGREEELRQVKLLLVDNRLLLLTGAGGVGKSRLALAAAMEVRGAFRDGVWLVEFAPLARPEQIPGAIALAMGLGEGPIQPNIEGLCNFLSSRQALLILDNCEHLIETCAAAAQALLLACPQLKIMATSRERLGLPGEVIYRVPSLGFPDGDTPRWENGLDYAAVRMFADRARAVISDFEVREENWQAVAQICRRLGGIPLALELAASHLDVLAPAQLSARLDRSFQILSNDGRAVLSRHKTLQATIDWSYGGLSEQERLLLQRLSVFTGGWTLEAAEAVCAGPEIPPEGAPPGDVIFSGLTHLINKSMVESRRQPGGETRFYLLETVRQFAQEKLGRSQEQEATRARHCAYFVQVSEAAMLRLRSGEHLAQMKTLDADRENIFSAVRWGIDEAHDIPSGLRILIGLDRYLLLRGFLYQGLAWLRRSLAQWQDPSPALLPVYTRALCICAHCETDPEAAFPLIHRALEILERHRSQNWYQLGDALFVAGYLYRSWRRDFHRAIEYMDRAYQFYLEARPPYLEWALAIILDEKSYSLLFLGNLDGAEALARESWRMLQRTGDHWFSSPLKVMAMVATRKGDYNRARDCLKEAIVQAAGVEDFQSIWARERLAFVDRLEGKYQEALAILREALRCSSEQFFNLQAINVFQEMAFTEIVCSRGKTKSVEEAHLRQAARLLGAVQACQLNDWMKVFVYPKVDREVMVAELRERLAPELLRLAWGEGEAMSVEESTREAMQYSLEI